MTMRNPPLSIACLVYLLCSLTPSIVKAQELSYARYDARDGLAGSVVYQCVQDKEGFLWFATETGVSRFDGIHFVNFTTSDGLPDNEILRLYVDSKNRVWMAPFKNALCYYYKGKIYNQQNDSTLRQIHTTTEVIGIAEDGLGNIFIASHYAVYRIDGQSNKVRLITQIDSAAFTYLGARFNGKMGVIQNKELPHATILNIDLHELSLTKDPTEYDQSFSGRSLLSPQLEVFHKNDSIYLIEPASRKEHSLYTGKDIKSVSRVNDSLLTLNSGNGTTIYNFNTGRLFRKCFEEEDINSVTSDREGNFWFMTNGRGIYRVGSFEFRNFVFNSGDDRNLPVYSVNKIGNSLYIGTNKSIVWRVDPLLNKHPIYLANSMGSGRVLAIAAYKDAIVFGTDKGLALFRSDQIRVSSTVSIKSITPYKDKMLVSANHALLQVADDLWLDNPLEGKRTTAVGVLHDTVFFGSTNGLYKVVGQFNSQFLGDLFPPLKTRITAIGTSPDSSTLWVATNGNGLIGFCGNRISHIINEGKGLTSNICRTLFVGDDYLWVGTDKGLNRIRINGDSCKVTNYTVEDGLLANIVNCVFVEGSQVYVGTQAGLTTFDANKISLNSSCQLRMTGIQASGQEWRYDTTGFTLPPQNNAIRFDYAGISFRSAGDITYRYRLTGLNDEWQTTRETYLSYPALPSGDYEFQVVATNKYGVQSDMIRVPFAVEKTIWEKTWFRILAIIFFWGLVWIFVHHRIKRIRKQNDEKMQINNRMADLEQMALKAQMNPHFIFNSLNSVQQYVIDKDILGANKFITEFSRLIRLTLDISSKTRISIYEEISYLATYVELEKTKFENKFTYSVTAAADLDTDNWYIPPMILQPYVENSIRHGVRHRLDNKGHVAITFYTEPGYLVCSVEDNGVGRKKAGQYKSELAIEYQSKGMTLTAKRIEMLNKGMATPVLINIEDLTVNDNPAGTRVILKFPIEGVGNNS